MFLNFLKKTHKIFESSLLITQKIHTFKAFLISSLNFILRNQQMKINDIRKLDSLIISFVNKEIKGINPTPFRKKLHL